MTKPGVDALVRIALRQTVRDDLPLFYEHQKDPEANRMAAFTPKDPADRQTFDEHWERILGDDAIVVRTITADGEVVGHISLFEMFGEFEVSYWIAKEHWGRGFATRALKLFLREVTVRPLHGRAAKRNVASARVREVRVSPLRRGKRLLRLPRRGRRGMGLRLGGVAQLHEGVHSERVPFGGSEPD